MYIDIFLGDERTGTRYKREDARKLVEYHNRTVFTIRPSSVMVDGKKKGVLAVFLPYGRKDIYEKKDIKTNRRKNTNEHSWIDDIINDD